VTFSTGIAAGGNLAYWYFLYASPIKRSNDLLMNTKDEFPRNVRIHVHHSSSHCRDMLLASTRRIDLPVGG
jgi:hypothetical protein